AAACYRVGAMPELPEVETVRRGLAARLTGRAIRRTEVRRPDLRYPLPERLAERLTGRRVDRLTRRGKYILVHLDDGMVLIIHLGMSGRMTIGERPAAGAATHDHVVLETDDGAVIAFNDARRFGMMDLVPED